MIVAFDTESYSFLARIAPLHVMHIKNIVVLTSSWKVVPRKGWNLTETESGNFIVNSKYFTKRDYFDLFLCCPVIIITFTTSSRL